MVKICPDDHKHDGNTVCYIRHLCRCAECREAMRVREKERRKLKAYGRYDSGLVDAAPVRAHVEYLRSRGMGWKFIAERAGIGYTAMEQLVYGRKAGPGDPRKNAPMKRIGREKAEKIMAVRPVLRPGVQVSGVGSRRRLQALVWAGWPVSELASRLGTIPEVLRSTLRGNNVTAARHRDISNLFSELFAVDPPQLTSTQRANVTKARKFARSKGWVSALAWDDIDNPDEVPQDAPRQAGRQPIDRELVQRMWAEGLSDGVIASRLGCADRTVLRVRHEIGLVTKWAA